MSTDLSYRICFNYTGRDRESLYRKTQGEILAQFAYKRAIVDAFREGVKKGFLRKGKPVPVAPGVYPSFVPESAVAKKMLANDDPDLNWECAMAQDQKQNTSEDSLS